MGDNLKRGFDFATAEGLQSGEDLEDLVTLATLKNNDGSANRWYDDLSIHLNADANPKFQVKDGGITTAKLADGAVTGDKLGSGAVLGGPIILKGGTFPGNVTVGSGAVTQSGFGVDPISNQADWDEVIDDDDTELATTGTISANTTARIFVDLGSVFIGTILTLMKATQNAAGDALTFNHVWAFDSDTVITGLGGTRTTQGAGGLIAGEQYSTFSHFYGQFVGLELQNIASSALASINLARFEIHGVAL